VRSWSWSAELDTTRSFRKVHVWNRQIRSRVNGNTYRTGSEDAAPVQVRENGLDDILVAAVAENVDGRHGEW
jgi:hypothetical protein